jgi:acetoacetyl-CoA reductase/3-oxoacyl-[acyl-carrier protein] reductase
MGTASWDFTGDVALVTGASSGIGFAIARALGAAGARVHGLDVASPAEAGENVEHHSVDLRDDEAVRAAVADVAEREKRIDLLANVAGITRDGALWKLSAEDWDAVLDVNLTAAWRVLRAVAPHMRAAGRGRIVQIASVNGLRGKFGQANYAASKAGLIGLTRAAARELGPKGITINAIAPGMIETPMAAALAPEVLERARAEACLGRLGTPEQVADAALFLLSDAAAHVTGTVLCVDGGQLA